MVLKLIWDLLQKISILFSNLEDGFLRLLTMTIPPKQSFTWILLLAVALVFSSCNKHEHDPEPTNGALMFHIHTMADTNEVEDYGTEYTLTGGRKIKIDQAQLYISEIELIKPDGSFFPVSGRVIFKKLESEEYEIGEVPIGSYKTIRFKVGLNPTLNASTPLASDTVLNQPSMWFGTSSQPDGYVFANFKGSIDTSVSVNGAALTRFEFRIGTSAHFQTVTLPDQEFSVSKSGGVVHFEIDYARLLKNVNLKEPLFVTDKSDNSSGLAGTVALNILDLFGYHN